MKYRFLCTLAALAALAALSACDRTPQQGDSSSERPPVASPASTASTAAVNDTVVLGGVRLNFPNHVRSTKDVTTDDGTVTHRMAVEYIGPDLSALDADLRKALATKNYTLAGPSERDGVSRYLVMSGKVRVGQVAVSPVGPALTIKLGAPGATGIALFIWQDPKPAN